MAFEGIQTGLSKSEHLRHHHEGESASAAGEIDKMEEEIKKLREELTKANMSLNHGGGAW